MIYKQNLFKARTHGYKTYRIPGIVVTENGTVIASAEARPGQGGDYSLNDVLIRHSTDGAIASRHSLSSSTIRITATDISKRAREYLEQWTKSMQATMPCGYNEDPFSAVIREGGPSHTRVHKLEHFVQQLKGAGLKKEADALA